MAIYHFSAKVISRAAGSSAVASAAYRSASRLHDRRLDRHQDFSDKSGVVHSEVMTPDGVPEHLRDASYQGAKRLGHGEGYQYAHDGTDHFVAQDYLGADKKYYEPTEQGVEKKIKERLESWRKQTEAAHKKTIR